MDRLGASQRNIMRALGVAWGVECVLWPAAWWLLAPRLFAGVVIGSHALAILVVRSILRRHFADTERAIAGPSLQTLDLPASEPEGTPRSKDTLIEDTFRQMRQDVSSRLETVVSSSDTLHRIADELSRATLRITSETTTVSVSAEDVHRQVRAIVASQEEFLATIADIGRHATRSAQMGTEASDLAAAAAATIDELTSACEKIGAMTALISGIASQTNLLALNATIEAARAGEHGRGFAVVAAEVKALAKESARAASMIVETVSSIRESTGQAIKAIAAAEGSIGGLNRVTSDIATAVDERVHASASLAQSMSRTEEIVAFVNAAIGNIEAVVDEAVQGAGFLRATAQEIDSQAAAMRSRLGVCFEIEESIDRAVFAA